MFLLCNRSFSLSFILLMLFQSCSAVWEDNCGCHENKYSAEVNQELSKEEMYKRGHLKPFGSHRSPLNVERLQYMIAPEDFYMNFVVKHKPVIIKGVTQSWPAHQLWTDEYLEEKYGETNMNMETKDDDKYNMPSGRRIKDFLKVYKGANSNLYMVDQVPPAMREEVKMPLCLQCEEIDRFFYVSYYWHSNGGTMSTVHIDTDENLLCVMKGHKKVIMVSPVHSHALYADSAKQMGVLDLNSSAVDLDKFPRVMDVPYYETMVEEGDCVYIPQMWWHQVYSREERQQAIAMWWKSKPYWKEKDEEGTSSTSAPKDKRKKNHSYADALIDYEYWIQNVSSSVPRIKCKEQDVRMSKYTWETGDDNSDYLLEEEPFGDVEVVDTENTASEVDRKVKEARKALGVHCDFDVANEKSPCHHGGFDDENLEYIRYVMDYCQQYEDRGCVINQPQIMTKLYQKDIQTMKLMKSKLESETR